MQAPLAPTQLEQCIGGYRIARMIHVAAQIGIAPALAQWPRNAAEVAAAIGANEGAMRTFLDALATWGVISRDGSGVYAVNDFSRRLLPDAPDAVNVEMITGWAGSRAAYDAYGGLAHTVLTGESGLKGVHGIGFHDFLAHNPADAHRYNRAMVTTLEAFRAAATACDFGDTDCFVDIGGGQGEMLRVFLDHYPNARGICFDLPHVVHGVEPPHHRLKFEAGDALEHVPAGADTYLTNTVLRCLDDDQCLRLLQNVRAAMTHPRGTLVSFEFVLPSQKDDPVLALADLTARVVYGGRDRTESEFKDLFAQAGLQYERLLPYQGAMKALVARRA